MCLHVHAGLFKPQGIVRTPLTLLSFAMWRGLAPFAGCCKTLGEGVKYKTYLLCWLLQGGQFAWRAITNCAVLQVKKNHLLRHKWQNGKKGNIFIDLPKCKMYRNTSVSGVVRGKGREGGRERERERERETFSKELTSSGFSPYLLILVLSVTENMTKHRTTAVCPILQAMCRGDSEDCQNRKSKSLTHICNLYQQANRQAPPRTSQ